MRFRVKGKRSKIRFIPVNAQRMIEDYLALTGHRSDVESALFRRGKQMNGFAARQAATNAPSHDADIAKVPKWLRHANESTTRLYGRRKTKPEDVPLFG